MDKDEAVELSEAIEPTLKDFELLLEMSIELAEVRCREKGGDIALLKRCVEKELTALRHKIDRLYK